MRNDDSFVGYYASNALHAAPAAQNYLTNLMLYFITPDLDLRYFPGKKTNFLRKEFPIQILTYNNPIKEHEVWKVLVP